MPLPGLYEFLPFLGIHHALPRLRFLTVKDDEPSPSPPPPAPPPPPPPTPPLSRGEGRREENIPPQHERRTKRDCFFFFFFVFFFFFLPSPPFRTRIGKRVGFLECAVVTPPPRRSKALLSLPRSDFCRRVDSLALFSVGTFS